MNRSFNVSVDGGTIVLGNWDTQTDGEAAVSHGVAPNVDSIAFYPTMNGEVTDKRGSSMFKGLVDHFEERGAL